VISIPPLASPSFNSPAALIVAGALVTRTDDPRLASPEVNVYFCVVVSNVASNPE